MNQIQTAFAGVARQFPVDWKSGEADVHGAERENLRANFAAIILNGLFFPTAGKILGAGLLLTWFLNELKPSALLVASLVPIQYGASLLAQPWIGQWMSTRSQRVRYYRNQALLRATAWAALGATVAVMRANTSLLLAVFFAVVIVDSVAAGVGNIAFSDTLARTIPPALRGRARGGRGMAGAIVAGLAGLLISRFVSRESGQHAFAWLFAIAGICYGLGGLTFGSIVDPLSKAPRPKRHIPKTIGRRVRAMFSTRGYSRFLSVQLLLIPATLGLSFFGLYGRREFHLDLKAFGLLVVSDAIAPFLGNFFWGKWADRIGNRWVLALSACVSLPAPALALIASFTGRGWSHSVVLVAFGLIVFSLGLAGSGVELASKNFVLELAPDNTQRAVYIGVNDTLVGIPTMLLVIGGAIIDWFGFRPMFVGIAVCSGCAAALAFLLPRRIRPVLSVEGTAKKAARDYQIGRILIYSPNSIMRAMVLERPKDPLVECDRPLPEPAPNQVRVQVRACGICRTDLHLCDGELPNPKLPVIPGHEIVGVVDKLGSEVRHFSIGQRVGVPWLAHTCGECPWCRTGRENLCDHALFTGYLVDGGYAEFAVAEASHCFPIPDNFDDVHAAPLLCAGLIGYRALHIAGSARRLGLYGFGVAAHVIIQFATARGQRVYTFTRPGDVEGQSFSRELGAVWAGDSQSPPPEPLDAAIIFAPVGALVPAALQAVDKGGRVVCAGIHMSDIPAFPYQLLWQERSVCSVANLTRQDGQDFFAALHEIDVHTSVKTYPLAAANEAISDLRNGKIKGAAVLVP